MTNILRSISHLLAAIFNNRAEFERLWNASVLGKPPNLPRVGRGNGRARRAAITESSDVSCAGRQWLSGKHNSMLLTRGGCVSRTVCCFTQSKATAVYASKVRQTLGL